MQTRNAIAAILAVEVGKKVVLGVVETSVEVGKKGSC